MKFLTPEIEALSKQVEGKSLVKPGTSCGIFQDCNPNGKANYPNYSSFQKSTAND